MAPSSSLYSTRLQTQVVQLVMRHLSRPVHGNTYARGVLPPQDGTESVCIAVGTRDAYAPDLSVYEIPLVQDDIVITAGEALRIVRTAQTADPFYRTFYREDENDLSQMPYLVLDLLDIRGDQDDEEPTPPAPTTGPYLVGFLPLSPGRHRLYWSDGTWPGILASDLDHPGTPEALRAAAARALPDPRSAWPSKDPHCWRLAPLLEP